MANTISAKKDLTSQAKRTADMAEETAHTLRDAAHEAGHNVREFLHEKSEQVAEIRKSTEQKISRNPLESVAIAALGGLLLGALLRR